MESRALGKQTIRLSPIIMGTWQTGKSMWTGIDDAQSEKAIRAAMDAGITTFDTAEVYGNGHSEKVLGKAIGTHRDKVVILSKVFSNHLKYDQVIAACNRSLKNLGTDYLDHYQIHWPPGSFGGQTGAHGRDHAGIDGSQGPGKNPRHRRIQLFSRSAQSHM
jgi:myo-inositol catabolism protein IolS